MQLLGGHVPERSLMHRGNWFVELSKQGALSPDGLFPEAGAATAVRALQSSDDSLKGVKFDLAAVYTNEFVKRANQKFAKA